MLSPAVDFTGMRRRYEYIQNLRLKPGQHKLMTVIAGHVNYDTAQAYLSVETISTESGFKVRWTQMLLRQLEALKCLKIDQGKGRGNVNVYTICKVAKVCIDDFLEEVTEKVQSDLEKVQSPTEKVQSSTLKGAFQCTPPILLMNRIMNRKKGLK